MKKTLFFVLFFFLLAVSISPANAVLERWPRANMTGDNAPVNYLSLMTDSSKVIAGRNTWKMFNDNAIEGQANQFGGQNGFPYKIIIYLNDSFVNVSKMEMTSTGDAIGAHPAAYHIYGSNDNSTWNHIYSNTSLTHTTITCADTNCRRYGNITITNTGFYKYYLLNFTAGDGGNLYINDMVLWGEDNSSVAGPAPVLTIQLNNTVNASLIGGFCINATGTNTTQHLCNATGNSISFNTSGTYNITAFNITSGHSTPVYFNVTSQNYAFTTTTTIILNTYQSIINISAYRLFLNTSIQTFNVTNDKIYNLSTAGSLLVFANNGSNNVQGYVLGNYSLNTTCTSAPVQTTFCNITGFYDNRFSIGANSNGVSISSFNTTIINTSIGASNTSQTSSHEIIFNLLQGYYYTFLMNASNYTLANVTIPANASTNRYNFSLYQAETINVTLLDEITGLRITNETFTFEIISNTYSLNVTFNNGTYNISFLTPNEYTLRYRSANYQERDYYVTINPQSYQNIDLYAIMINQSDQVTTTVKDTSNTPVQNATVKLLRYYVNCNCYKVVQMSKSSYSGNGIFWVQLVDGHYKWSVDYQGTTYFLSSTAEQITSDTRNFIINLGTDFYQSDDILGDLGSLVTFNPATETLTYTWNDPSGLTTYGCLDVSVVNVTKISHYSYACTAGSTGSMNAVLSNTNTTKYMYTASINTSTRYSNHPVKNGFIERNLRDSFGSLGVFLAGGFMITVALIFSYSAVAVLITTPISIILVAALGLMTFQTTFIVGFIAISIGMALYLMRS